MRIKVFRALLVLCLALTGTVALAQTTGDIEGTLTDQSGAPLPGASVEVRSASLIGSRSVVSDAGGRFRFPALPPGTYTVTASLSGFSKVERTNIQVKLGATATLPISMNVSVKEEVIVTGEAPVIDVTRTTVGTNTSLETIQKLPLGRNFTSIATTVAGTGTSAGGGITVYGATGLENSYVIDGVNTTGIKIGDQGKLLNNEFIQEVEVKTGGYEAEYSRALGGVINVVTKSGGNEFHGDLFGYYDSDKLASDDKRVDEKALVGLGETVLPRRLDVGFDLGGYFVKDRLWFFGAYDRVNRDQDLNVGVGRTYTSTGVATTQFAPRTDETRTNLYSGKLTFRLGEANTIALAAFGDPGTFKGQLLAIVGTDSSREGENDFGGTDFSAKWDGIIGTQFLGQFQYGHHSEKSEDKPASTALSVRDVRGGLSTYFGGHLLYTKEKYKRDAFQLKGTGFFGAHEVKAGIDYEAINSDYFQAYGGGGRITNFLSSGGAFLEAGARYYAAVRGGGVNCIGRYDADGNLIRGNFGTPGPQNATIPTIQDCAGYEVGASVTNEPETNNLGFFVQDSWKIMSNLSLNAGIRYDQQTLKDADGNDRIKLKNEWSPRVGVIWDFTNNGRSKAFVNFGRYYTVIPQDIQTRALGNEYTVFAYNYSQSTLDPIDSVYGYAYIQGGQITAPGLKGMYQDEWIAGVEYEVVKNWSVGVKGIYKSLRRTAEDRCDLLDPRQPNLAAFVPEGSLTSCAIVNPGEQGEISILKDPTNPDCQGPDGNAATLDGDCDSVIPRRFYRGIELTATHRFANNFYLLANYVYSSLKGNYDGNEKQSTGQQDPNINADFDYIDMIPNNFGRLSLDRKHQFKLSGNYSFGFGLTVGANFRYNSGAPFAIRGIARPGYTGELYLLPDRGDAGNLPATYEADLHVEYGVKAGPVTITPIVDVFNLLNRQQVTARSGVFNTINDPGRLNFNNRYNQPTNRTASIDARRNNAAECAASPSYLTYGCSTNRNFLRDTGWSNPLQVRLGARISF